MAKQSNKLTRGRAHVTNPHLTCRTLCHLPAAKHESYSSPDSARVASSRPVCKTCLREYRRSYGASSFKAEPLTNLGPHNLMGARIRKMEIVQNDIVEMMSPAEIENRLLDLRLLAQPLDDPFALRGEMAQASMDDALSPPDDDPWAEDLDILDIEDEYDPEV